MTASLRGRPGGHVSSATGTWEDDNLTAMTHVLDTEA